MKRIYFPTIIPAAERKPDGAEENRKQAEQISIAIQAALKMFDECFANVMPKASNIIPYHRLAFSKDMFVAANDNQSSSKQS